MTPEEVLDLVETTEDVSEKVTVSKSAASAWMEYIFRFITDCEKQNLGEPEKIHDIEFRIQGEKAYMVGQVDFEEVTAYPTLEIPTHLWTWKDLLE